MKDGKYVVEFMTESVLSNDRAIRIGDFEVSHDWIISVNGPELEEDMKLGPITSRTEDLIERQWNNGYYRVREVEEDPLEPRRKTPTWSAG